MIHHPGPIDSRQRMHHALSQFQNREIRAVSRGLGAAAGGGGDEGRGERGGGGGGENSAQRDAADGSIVQICEETLGTVRK
jgi:hypothetical protein